MDILRIYSNISASEVCYLNFEECTKIYKNVPRVLMNTVYSYIRENIPKIIKNILKICSKATRVYHKREKNSSVFL